MGEGSPAFLTLAHAATCLTLHFTPKELFAECDMVNVD